MLSPLATTPVGSIVPRGKRLGPTPTCPPTRSSIAVAFYRTHASAIRATMGRPPLRLLECIFRMRGRRGDRGRRWHVGARARGSGFRSGGPSRRVARACPPGPLATHGYDRVFDWRGRGAAGGSGQLADHELLEAAAARLEMLIACKDSRSAIKSKGVPACVQLLTSHELKVVRLHASHVLAVQVDDSDRKERRRSLANQGLFNYKGTHGVCKDTNSRRYPPQCCAAAGVTVTPCLVVAAARALPPRPDRPKRRGTYPPLRLPPSAAAAMANTFAPPTSAAPRAARPRPACTRRLSAKRRSARPRIRRARATRGDRVKDAAARHGTSSRAERELVPLQRRRRAHGHDQRPAADVAARRTLPRCALTCTRPSVARRCRTGT